MALEVTTGHGFCVSFAKKTKKGELSVSNLSRNQAEELFLLLATDRQIHAFDLSQTFRIAIGRHESNDLQLGSRTVSNYHAEILNEPEGLILQDLRSTNGTFVNNQPVNRQRLTPGDRIRVGNFVLTVHRQPRRSASENYYRLTEESSFAVGTRGNLISLRAGSPEAQKTLRAQDPRDLSLPDLLKFLGANRRAAVVVARRQAEEGRVVAREGSILHAELGSANGEKALYRLFAWERAAYEVAEFPRSSVPRTIHLPTDALILEGMHQVDEMERLRKLLPPFDQKLRLKESCTLPICALSPAEIEVFQGIIRYETIDKMLEGSLLTDSRALGLVNSLLQRGVFEVGDSSPALLESTVVSRSERRNSG